jgi:hypothetical protein
MEILGCSYDTAYDRLSNDPNFYFSVRECVHSEQGIRDAVNIAMGKFAQQTT